MYCDTPSFASNLKSNFVSPPGVGYRMFHQQHPQGHTQVLTPSTHSLVWTFSPVALQLALLLIVGSPATTVAAQQETADADAQATPADREEDKLELGFRDLFNGKDLTGWIDVNTSPETWSVKDGLLICTGKPIGVMRTDKQYENFILQIEWRHMEAGGNSGVFLWCDAIPNNGNRLPKGMEVQMLELDWINQHQYKDGSFPPSAYVEGELFGAGGMTAIPENPRGKRSKSVEQRCKGKGEWNKYVVVAVGGNVKLSINGKFVNGIRDASVRKGYLCLESEGKEIHFRNIKIMELPPGQANESNTAPVIAEEPK